MATPEPAYTIEVHDGEFELRCYAPRIVAEVSVEGSFRAAGNAGFRRLARFIFGHNHARASSAATAPVGERAAPPRAIPMTAPVGERAAPPRAIPMTAPVGERAAAAPGERWTVSFTMPVGETLAALPVPIDPGISLRQLPEQRIAVIRQRGRWTDARFAQMTAALRQWTTARGLEIEGSPEVNRYDPPWTPWFLRRNEVWLSVVDTPR